MPNRRPVKRFGATLLATGLTLLMYTLTATIGSIFSQAGFVRLGSGDTSVLGNAWLPRWYVPAGIFPPPDWPDGGPHPPRWHPTMIWTPDWWWPDFYPPWTLRNLAVDNSAFGNTMPKLGRLACPTKTSPTVVTDSVYIADDCGFVYRLDAESLQTRARKRFSSGFEAPIHVLDDHSVLANGHSRIWLLDRETLEPLDSAPHNWSEAAPLVLDDIGSTVILDESGFATWHRTSDLSVASRIQVGPACESSPVRHRDTVVFGCNDGNIYASDLSGTALLWSIDTDGDVEGQVTIVGGGLIVPVRSPDRNGDVRSYDWDTRKLRWQVPMGTPIQTRPTLCGKFLVAAGDHALAAIHPESGRIAWQTRLSGRTEADPACINDEIWIGTMRGHLYRIDPGSGQTVARYLTGGIIYENKIVAGNGSIWAADMTGRIYRFGD